MSKYELGPNVTDAAKAVEDRKSVVLSFRMTDDEFEFLSRIADKEGKRVSQVARECLLRGLHQGDNESWMSVGLVNGAKATFGNPPGPTWVDGWVYDD